MLVRQTVFVIKPKNWKTDEFVLGDLEDVHITGLQGVGHEVAFVQRLIGWATVLKSLRITLDNKLTEGKAMELREALAAGFCVGQKHAYNLTGLATRSLHLIAQED